MSGFEGRDPYDDYVIINKELENFNKKIMDKPQIIIANKMDMESAKENLENFKKKLGTDTPIYEVSAIKGEGFDQVLVVLADMLDKIEKEPLYEEERFESHVLYKFKAEQPFKVIKESENVYVVKGEEIERIYKMTWFVTDEAFLRFSNKLRKLGIDDKLKEMGIQNGDTVKILDYEFV
jgi:GTP-binding protein